MIRRLSLSDRSIVRALSLNQASFSCLNLGDMEAACRHLWRTIEPEAMIQIVTKGPELLQSAVPKALPLIAGDRFDLFHPFARLEELGLGLGTFFARLRRAIVGPVYIPTIGAPGRNQTKLLVRDTGSSVAFLNASEAPTCSYFRAPA
jgi:hypothetical protein